MRDRPEQEALAPAGLEPGFLVRGQAMLGAQPGEDGLVVVVGLQQALGPRPAVQAAAAVELGRHDELFERADGGGRRDDGLELVGEQLAARHSDMAADAQALAVGVLSGHLRQPFDDALRLALPHRLDAGVPAPADAIDAFDQLGQGEDVGRLQMAGQPGVQPGGHGIAGLRCLRDLPFQPAQRVELAPDQPAAPAQTPGGRTVLRFVGRDLIGLTLVFQPLRFGERFQAGEIVRRVRDAGGVHLRRCPA